MQIKLIPKTTEAKQIAKRHGLTFEVKNIKVNHLTNKGNRQPFFHVVSMFDTNYFPFVGHRPYLIKLNCEGDQHWDYKVL